MFGYGGDDQLFGGTGNDLLQGDANTVAYEHHGNDYLDGEEGDDTLVGGGGGDELFGGDGADQLFGDSDDTPVANQGNDYLDGEAGNDYLRAYGGNDTLFGGIGNDSLQGEAGDDYLDGEADDDILEGGDGDDQLFGGLGNDGLLAGAGDDYLDGGEGIDNLFGGAGNDQVFGGAGNDQVGGGDGDDFLDAGDGDDTLFGDAGNDSLVGGAGRDTFVGGLGDDIFVVNFAENEGVVDEGGTNTLQVAYSGPISALQVVQAFDPLGGSNLMLYNGEQFVQIKDGFAGAVSIFDFGGGNVLTRQQLMAQAQVESLVLAGGTGSQHLIASNNADQIDGGAGIDTMEGGAGSDDYIVDDSADVIVENANEGIDSVTSSASYTLSANVENLTLTGVDPINATGNASDNLLTGNTASNVLDGAAGNDTLAGGFGGDTYLFGRGNGQDVIQESDDGTLPVDRVMFAADTLATDVAVSGNGTDLVLSITGTTDRLTVAGYFSSIGSMVEEFRFADGTVWDDTVIAEKLSSGTTGNDFITGTAGNDFLNGLAGNDTINGQNGDDRLFGAEGLDSLNGGNGADILDGGVGNDTLLGGNGADTYVFARGYGQDVISESDDGSNPIDRLEFAADILPTDVTARRSALNLELSVNGTADKATIAGYFSNDAVGPQVVEQIRFGDGTTWDVATVKGLVLLPTEGNDTLTGYASADFIDGAGGADVIDGGAGNDTLLGGAGSDSLTGGAGDDMLRGGPGSDTMTGGAGSDTYLFNLGDGSGIGSHLIFNGDSSTSTTDTLLFGSGILPGPGFLTRGGTDVDLFVGSVKIPGYFSSPGNPSEVDEICFTDDPTIVWTPSVVRALLLAGTDIEQFIVGFNTDDTIDGLGGDDTIRGALGNDTIFGGTGNDTLFGNAGSDSLVGGAGNDQLNGEEFDSQFETPGADTLDGGAGADTLRGHRGNDTYVFGRGYGHDIVDETGFADGADTLRLNAGVLTSDVSLFRQADDLVVAISGDTAQAWVTQYFTLANKPIEQIVFNDGTVWDTAAIASRVIAGTQNSFTGTAGNDTFVVDHVGDTITEGVNQGTDTVQSGVSYTLPANVENITLTGTLDINATGNSLNNNLTGNSGNNQLTGGGGTDTLIGGLGDDVLTGDGSLIGGQGDDTYVTTDAGTIVENAGEGIDTVVINSTLYTLPANIENGTEASNSIFTVQLVGNALNNVLTGRGNVTNDTFDGGAGADTMIAQGGKFTVDNPGDRVITVSGTDTFIKSSINWTLADTHRGLELLAGTPAAVGTGNAANNDLVGNANANLLSGLDGADTLYGGMGTDTLVGGQGNDTYFIADVRTVVGTQVRYGLNSPASVMDDSVVEAAGEGLDTVNSLFDYTLPDNVENLVLMTSTTGFATVQARNGTGNALANQITGNSADNVIDGRQGADVMIGSSGNDTYYVDDAGDVVSEFASGGNDTVISQAPSFTLSAGSQVETIVLAGTAPISVTGNELNNTIDGSQNSAGNVLAGGLGNDTYIVGSGDTIVENAGEGIDTARSDVSFTLGANVENLILTGSAATTGTGDSLDNVLDGTQNAAANTLVGGQGNDTYLVDSGDTIVENAGEGIDTVMAASNYTLGANVENLTLTGDGNYSALGSADDNLIIGNAHFNSIDGGAGADTMRGMDGDDFYWVDNAGDIVDETGGSGNDAVFSQVSFTLGVGVENLFLIAGTAAIGNELDNSISANEAANILDGGAGADMLSGGDGDDTYRFGRGYGNDTIFEEDPVGGSMDIVELGANIAPADVVVSRSGDDLILSISGTADSLRLGSFLSGPGNEVERVVFSDGTIWTAAMLREMGVINGTAGADTLNGTPVDDTIFGLAGNDALNGLGGNDFLDGGTGADTMTGDLGDDVYVVDNTGDMVIETSAAGGFDHVSSSVNFTLGNNVESLALAGTNPINGTGNALDNTIIGNDANNVLDGKAGADLMSGGFGNDTYFVDNAGDVVFDEVNGGIDAVQSSVSFTLPSDVENLTLTLTGAISGTGNELNNVLTGNSANNTLTGGAGNDTLDGGAGTDSMVGGTGDDTYIVAQTTDLTTENANEGIDTVQSSITWTLNNTNGNNIENLTLTGTSLINGTGNALNNVLTGNSVNNSLTGGAGNDTLDGGAGTDTMVGGTGNDIYVVAQTTDVTTENANEGIDTVQSLITWTLSNTSGNNIENLTLTGTNAIDGTGNTLANVITGNSANNVLNGGTGSDTLVGGLGNDTYVVDVTGDVTTENANEGIDTVQSSITWTLNNTNGNNIENLTLTGTSVINGTGNALNNLLTGNSVNNSLTGGAGNDTLDGGAGTDSMVGGTGDDTYVVAQTTDLTTENANEGLDTVQSSITWTLNNTNGNNIENLTLTGTSVINGTGNALNNVLTGNSVNNSLTGGAGQ